MENQRDAIALVFNGPVDGTSIRVSDIFVAGPNVTQINWLDGTGANVIAVGDTTTSPGSVTDTDFKASTSVSNRADDTITNNAPGGFGPQG